MQKAKFGRLDPQKDDPLVLFFSMESSVSKLVHLLVKKFLDFDYPGALKVIQNDSKQNGILWFTEHLHKNYLIYLHNSFMKEAGEIVSEAREVQFLVHSHTVSHSNWFRARTAYLLPHPYCTFMEVVDSVGSSPTDIVWVSLPGSGPCGSKPCWSLLCIRGGSSS